jgi:hypothetical protein
MPMRRSSAEGLVGQIKVLLVDDHPIVRRAIVLLLKEAGDIVV